MMFKTHLAFGILTALLIAEFFDFTEKGVFIGIVIFSSILPDLDMPLSKVGSKVRPLSWLINLLFGHRGMIHSIWVPILVYIILRVFEKDLWAGAFFIGYISHLVIDMFNIKGVYFFRPINNTRINGFIKTGGILEYILFFSIVVGVVLVLL